MRYEWDEAKRQSNIQKHGIDFVGIEKAFDGTISVRKATKNEEAGYFKEIAH